jgi:hypothetical protein
MKRKLFNMAGALAALLVMGAGLSGCASVNITQRMDGVIPFEFFQNVKDEHERLVCFAPVLAPNHSESYLFIITNPEDIQEAQDAFGNPDAASFRDIEKALKDFSPVMIKSNIQEMLGSAYNRNSRQMGPREKIRLGDGIAVFSIPASVENFFYVYIRYKTDVRITANAETEVLSGIMPFPPDSQDAFIGFTEDTDGMNSFAVTGSAKIQAIYDGTTGLYGYYLSPKQKQEGFIEIKSNDRWQLLHG